MQFLFRRPDPPFAKEPCMPRSAAVETFMATLDHPFKAEIAAVRAIVLAADPRVRERIKWKAPSFYHGTDLGAFNLHATEFVHLILVFPQGRMVSDPAGLLLGAHKDRREIKFTSLEDVASKKAALTSLVREWLDIADAAMLAEAARLPVAV